MTPHEEEMLAEIQDLHTSLAQSEKSRLGWKLFSILCILGFALLLWLKLR